MTDVMRRTAAVVDSAVRCVLARGPDSGWESGLSLVIAAYSLSLPYHLLSSDPDFVDVQTFPTALALVKHLRRAYGRPPLGRDASRQSDCRLEKAAVRLLETNTARVQREQQPWSDSSDTCSCCQPEVWDQQVAVLQGERVELEPPAADASSSSSSPSSAASAPALLATLLPLEPPFFVFFQSGFGSGRTRAPYQILKAATEEALGPLLCLHGECEDMQDFEDEDMQPQPQLSLAAQLSAALLQWQEVLPECKCQCGYLSAVFHRVRRVYLAPQE